MMADVKLFVFVILCAGVSVSYGAEQEEKGGEARKKYPHFKQVALLLQTPEGLLPLKNLLGDSMNPNMRNPTTDRSPLLSVAARSGNRPACELLLQKKANVNATDGEKNTPLHRVVEQLVICDQNHDLKNQLGD